ncbi:MAG: EAL domain-containing protein [Lactimicrobium sp.]|jgi:diguanylate cyclase (GGDEF)-like protein|uniref:EAL domain-containing protein n=1 Tax=Lactimicrobium sp. TaxID=2563780 RepID=UPI002F35BE8E
MSNKSSGTYIIDEDYNVINLNQTIKEMYPSLQIGKKCYQCLMGLNEPCPPCPVANHIQGPQTYMDPIRKIYENVDAVEVDLNNGKTGHALVMSTVGDSETIAAKLPRTKDELQKLLEQQYFDTLTDGYTRKGFIREAEHVFARSNQADYAMILFDIHNFKAINDIFGIEGGDQVLKFVFQSLKESWLNPVVSARIESDWFLFLVKQSDIKEDKLNDLVNMVWSKDSRAVHLHLRCGIYHVEDDQASVSRMVEWTILAKQSADLDKYGSIARFNAAMREKYIDQAEILSGFADSLLHEHFKVYYQPIIQAGSGKLCGAEALVRWQHPSRGFIVPDHFIPALEASGLITQLDLYVLKHVYAFQKEQLEKHIPIVPVSVNLSRQDFYNQSFMNEIFNLAQESSLTEGKINYEVTETAVAVLRENCAYLLQQLRKTGAKVLLDDFGSGYSSLGMIGDYAFDIVKIDKSFVDQIETKPNVRAVIDAAINMCHTIGMKTVAEGVENKTQLDFLKEHGCDYIQGYYYSRPLPQDAFLAYLQKSEIANAETVNTDLNRSSYDLDNLLDLVDHSGQFIQVCHPEDYSMVYANAMTRDISGHPDLPYQGAKCYQYMLGLDAPCGHCPMKLMGDETEKMVEVDDGSHVFSLKARYTTWNGRKVFMEYGHDITETKADERRYADQMRSILEHIPEGQGVFHMDLTADKWLSSGGNAKNARDIQNVKDVNTLIRQIGSFVPTSEGQKLFFDTFSRQAQMQAYAVNKRQIVLETESYYDDRSIRWSRITVHLIDNPNNNHVESILYGVDISKEKTHIEELQQERQQAIMEKKILQDRIDETWKLYAQADRDRRYDLLTCLNSRLDLYDFMKQEKQNAKSLVNAVMFLDVDDFKSINDTYGHACGDECLKAIGKAVSSFGAAHDIVFYRYGGEEIVGLCHIKKESVYDLARSLLDAIQSLTIHLSSGKDITVTASIGYTAKSADIIDMIQQADKAMYEAKKHGKNQTACLD